jgi:hypothetical protein
MQFFEIITKKRDFADGAFADIYHIARNKSHHGNIKVGKMVCCKDVGLSFFNIFLPFHFDGHKDQKKEKVGPKLIDFPAVFLPIWNPDANQKQGEK